MFASACAKNEWMRILCAIYSTCYCLPAFLYPYPLVRLFRLHGRNLPSKVTCELRTMRFKSAFTFEQRREKSALVVQLHPGHIPVICEPCDTVSSLAAPMLDKKKYLVHGSLTVGLLMNVIRRRMQLPRDKALFLLINKNTMAPVSHTLNEVYARHRDPDGFLYVSYAFENVFG